VFTYPTLHAYVGILQDDLPELAEGFLVNISSVELVGGSTGPGRPSLKRPGMEVAEVTIAENDDPRGIVQFNVSEVGVTWLLDHIVCLVHHYQVV